VPLPEVETPRFETGKKLINGVYFFKQGCTKCSRVFHDLKTVQAQFSMLNLRQLDIKENLLLAETLGEKAGVAKEKRLIAPSIFIGENKLVGDEINLDSLRILLEKYKDIGAPPIWEVDKIEVEATHREIINRFSTLAVTTVLMAGLIDGVNPCAFATIIFLVSYLSFIGRSRREILAVGISFSLAVFITYFLIGFGLLKFIERLSFMPVVARIVYIGTGSLALILGILSLMDAKDCLKGKTSDMALQLPKFLKRRIHKVIREESHISHYIVAAFVSGFIISLLELVCTGQVYLPTIIYVTKVPGFIWHAAAYLLMYNFFFVLPLIAVFLVFYFGVTSDELAHFMRKHIVAVKLSLAVLFFVLGGLLLYNA
jgi:hypothetical protein